jgi:GGDEF domain-containing protein
MTPGSVSERSILLSALAQQAGREVCNADMLSLSLGAAFYPLDGQDTEQLLAEADRRMYAAKQLHYEHYGLIPSGVAPRSHPVSVN